jgi:hypothetical protein
MPALEICLRQQGGALGVDIHATLDERGVTVVHAGESERTMSLDGALRQILGQLADEIIATWPDGLSLAPRAERRDTLWTQLRIVRDGRRHLYRFSLSSGDGAPDALRRITACFNAFIYAP